MLSVMSHVEMKDDGDGMSVGSVFDEPGAVSLPAICNFELLKLQIVDHLKDHLWDGGVGIEARHICDLELELVDLGNIYVERDVPAPDRVVGRISLKFMNSRGKFELVPIKHELLAQQIEGC